MSPKILSGKKPFLLGGKPTAHVVEEYWAWSSSDLLSNTLRGGLAEFIVATALNVNISESRVDWTEYDILHPSGRKIEVKSAAYLQTWNQTKDSQISFSISPARAWTPENGFGGEAERHADVYVFCLFACKDRAIADPLDLDQWEFYVLPTTVLNSRCPKQKNISLPSLLKLEPIQTDYGRLAEVVEKSLA